MRIRLAYGRHGLPLELPDDLDVTVIEPRFESGLVDPAGAVRAALEAPIGAPALREFVEPRGSVGIVFSDITRPAPNRLILPAILNALAEVPREQITLFNALGTHRRNSDAELREMLGNAIVDTYRIVQNDAFDESSQERVGRVRRGHDIWLNRELAHCQTKILTGFIEPHFFAGFSGGGKAVLPGMAGLHSILRNHDAEMIAHPQAAWGVTDGNPIWEEVQEALHLAGRTFLVNVALNKEKEITAVFAGDVEQAHRAGCEHVKRTAMIPVPHLFDIVIGTNSGYPLDMNLYQTVKGMSAAAQAVRPGGAVIVAAECSDGIPEHGLYAKLLAEAADPADLLARVTRPGMLVQDQWEAQIQAQVQMRADVYVYSDGLTAAQLTGALLKKSERIEDTVDELLRTMGRGASICVLPEGPQSIPYHR